MIHKHEFMMACFHRITRCATLAHSFVFLCAFRMSAHINQRFVTPAVEMKWSLYIKKKNMLPISLQCLHLQGHLLCTSLQTKRVSLFFFFFFWFSITPVSGHFILKQVCSSEHNLFDKIKLVINSKFS